MAFVLLQIPVDIRKYIFLFVLQNEHEAPNKLDQSRITFERENATLRGEQHNQYPPQLPPMYYSTLLQINKQISSEVKGIICSLLEGKQLRYKLDCFIGDEKIYPTWLSIPLLSTQVDIVEVNVRLASKQRRAFGGWGGGCRGCAGGPGPMVWSLAALLLRFVERGPDFLSKKKLNMQIGTILVNVLNTTEFCDEPVMSKEEEEYYGSVDSPKLQTLLEQEMGYLLKPEDSRAREMFQVLNGKVECVKLLYEGELVHNWKVEDGCPKVNE